ncbi:Siroheme synthase [compost metagenome]
MPVAVIQNGTREDERYVTGSIDEIAQRVREENLGSPAIIVVGRVVALHPDYVYQYAVQNLTI